MNHECLHPQDAQSCIETSRQKAASYLTNQVLNIDPEKDIFHLAITAYALSLTQEKSRTAYNILYDNRRLEGKGLVSGKVTASKTVSRMFPKRIRSWVSFS